MLNQPNKEIGLDYWFVLYTKPRQEKNVTQMLLKKGIEAYCPLKKQIKQWSDRKKIVESPLFNSYVFVKLDDSARSKVFSVAGVVRYLFCCGVPAKVKDAEINEINKWLQEYKSEEFEVLSFTINERVKIKSGDFKSQTGVIIKQNGKYLSLLLEGMGVILRTKLGDVTLEKSA